MSAALMLSRNPGSHGFTVADLHALPDDGPRYELIDGSIIVSPSATIDHNIIAHWIGNVLDESNPGEEYVVGYDQSATVDDHNEPRPDVVVTRASAFRQTPFPITDLVLAVEVVSQHSVLRDTETKRALYARAGVASYWIVVPDEHTPGMTLAELILDQRTGKYVYRTPYTPEALVTDLPWPVTVDLPRLVKKRERLFRAAAAATASPGAVSPTVPAE